VAGKNEGSELVNYPLINLSFKIFYPMFELGLWIFLIIGIIGGGIAGSCIGYAIDLRGGGRGIGAFLGILIGFIVSFLGMIQIGGLTSIFLKMNENIEKIEKKNQ
jgi:hypothetical protein